MSAASRRSRAPADAIQLLTADHKEVRTLFKAYSQLIHAEGGDDEKQMLALEICTKLTVHATIEEEFFYAAARQMLAGDEDLVDVADVKHACAKELIMQIVRSAPADPLYDARLRVLSEHVDHHVKEEEDEMFPKLRSSGLDVHALGQAMAARRDDLLAEMAGAE